MTGLPDSDAELQRSSAERIDMLRSRLEAERKLVGDLTKSMRSIDRQLGGVKAALYELQNTINQALRLAERG